MSIHKRKLSKPVELQEKPHGYEFFGPPGAFAITFGLPILVYASAFFCNDVSGCPAPALLHPKQLTWSKLKTQIPWPEEGIKGLASVEVTLWVSAYYFLSLFLQLVLPGDHVEGLQLNCGGRHMYKFNAFNSALVILAGLGVGTLMQGSHFVVWTYIWDNFIQILTANMLIATTTSIYVYLQSFTVPHAGQPNPENRELAKGGHSGNMLYDFFIGRELNPRFIFPKSLPIVGGQVLDIKIFNEMRPGLLGYIILDLAFVARQHRVYGTVTDSIAMITLFQAIYIADGLYMEPAVVTTMDITTDGFGYMLAFGDLVWVPFIYSIPARYLAVYPLRLGLSGIAGVLAIQALGFYLFRAANNEKNRFRQDPNDSRIKHLEYIETASGSKLLTSGWWGTARHINYLGDWIMGFSYVLPTGIAGYIVHHYTNPVTGKVHTEVDQGEAKGWGMIFTYFYIVYFGVLLVHRERRDEEKCKRKYGSDWNRYCDKVRWRILPGIY